MEPLQRIEAVALPIAQPNCDTDQITPARFLQKPRSDDFGRYLFADVRFRADGSEIPDFILNRPEYRAARIIAAERNFGCGSSREHAVWSLHDYGIRAVIAPSFGDIFRSNCLKNGLVPVVLPEDEVKALLDGLAASPGAHIAVDVVEQVVVFPDGSVRGFDIDPFAKHCIVQGLDELDYTLSQSSAIESFERDYDERHR
ncbi:3-isopropylmalate dehydratase small subunit [Azospirillum canadense]|uniref:3-isopropylmalate dehydratase small subunit n=1 Tax=Azospirillum canadense TaxID=403962 RepID=UPI002227F094|nr:3-isopropylmalate dehydratase small subunit [Azospirillum canadense]MCW2241429.1 3-isopropylmalate/(R)-2-methylmalate dehydratase small subunit [Azospirillum canadense]